MGAVHGLAGSGALTALVLATLTSTAARLTYMTLFGFGSTLGMALLSGALGWPLVLTNFTQALIPALQPAWTNYNPSDPGIVLIELLAWLTEMLIFQVNEIPAANTEKKAVGARPG